MSDLLLDRSNKLQYLAYIACLPACLPFIRVLSRTGCWADEVHALGSQSRSDGVSLMPRLSPFWA